MPTRFRHIGRPHAWVVDLLLGVLVLAGGLLACAVLTEGGRKVTFDCFRDTAWAENISAGRVWADPTLLGESWWTSPGNPLLFGGLAAVLDTPAIEITKSSAVWWNGLLPVLVFLVVRTSSDRLTATLAVPFVFVGSLWWMTHLPAPMPSVQGVALLLLGLASWRGLVRALFTGSIDDRNALWWSLLTGLVMAASAWYHPLCAMLLAATVSIHAVLIWLRPRRFGARVPGIAHHPLAALGVTGFTAALLSLPPMIHLLALPKEDTEAFTYFSRFLRNPDFALHAYAPLVVPLAIIGAFFLVRRPTMVWLFAYLAVGLTGQAAGYLNHVVGLPVPNLLTHEFQWHTQLAAGICAALGTVELTRFLSRRVPWPTTPAIATLLWAGLLTVAALSPALPYAEVADSFLADAEEIQANSRGLVQWIRGHTAIEDVILCPPLTGHTVVAGLTGRKCVAVPLMNPSVPSAPRHRDLSNLLAEEDETVFLELAHSYRIRYALVIVDSPEAAARLERWRSWESLVPTLALPAEASFVFRVEAPEAGV